MRELNRMKYSRAVARRIYMGRRSWWSLSFDPVLSARMNKRHFADLGYRALVLRHQERNAPIPVPNQLTLDFGMR